MTGEKWEDVRNIDISSINFNDMHSLSDCIYLKNPAFLISIMDTIHKQIQNSLSVVYVNENFKDLIINNNYNYTIIKNNISENYIINKNNNKFLNNEIKVKLRHPQVYSFFKFENIWVQTLNSVTHSNHCNMMTNSGLIRNNNTLINLNENTYNPLSYLNTTDLFFLIGDKTEFNLLNYTYKNESTNDINSLIKINKKIPKVIFKTFVESFYENKDLFNVKFKITNKFIISNLIFKK